MSKPSQSAESILLPLIVGTIVTVLLSGTLVIAGLKAGILPGVSPLVILFAWGAFARSIARGGGREFLNTAQVAGSAGVAVTAGVIFTAPVIQVLFRQRGMEVPAVDVLTLIYLCVAGAFIGFGFVGFGMTKFLTDPTLPAPEARSCHTMIEAAVIDPSKRPNLIVSMFAGLIASAMAPLLAALGIANGHIIILQKIQNGREFTFDLPFAPIYIGIGALLTLPTAMLVCGGSFLRLFGDYLLAGVEPETEMAAAFGNTSMQWIGGGAMTVAVVYSLIRLFGIATPKFDAGSSDAQILSIEPKHRFAQAIAILTGFGMIAGWLLQKDGINSFSVSMLIAIVICCGLMVVLGAILSLQVGSSASPVSGTVFVTVLVLSMIAIMAGRKEISDVLLIVPLMVAACVAICAANDSSQDFKTLQLCGLRVARGFLPQIAGLLAGCVSVPIVLYISHEAYGLGTENLKAPQATLFASVLEALLLLDGNLPWGPIAVGTTIGLCAVTAEHIGKRKGKQLPSMAFAVGIYLPPYLGVGIIIGALARYLAEGQNKQQSESILAAAGLIAGAAFYSLVIGGLIVLANTGLFEFSLEGMRVFELGDTTRNLVAAAGIALLCFIVYYNSAAKRR